MFEWKCPRADELEAVALGRDAPPRVRRHVAVCPTCTQIVAGLARDAELLTELRVAAEDDLDAEIREELLDACRAATKGPDVDLDCTRPTTAEADESED